MEKTIKFDELKPTTALYTNIVYSTRRGDFFRDLINLHLNLIVPTGQFAQTIKSPLLIWLEGGAWRNTSPYFRIPELTYFAQNGFAVANVQYSVSADNMWPACIEDIKTAIRFLRKNADKYGIDTSKIYIAGESAGAHLAALVGLTGDKFVAEEYKEYSSSVDGVICYYCPGDTDVKLNEYIDPYDLLARGNINDNPELKASINPMTYANQKACPFLFFHGLADTLVPIDCAKSLYNKLIENGTEADFYTVEGAGHADLAFSQPEIQQIILNFIKK